MPKCKPQRKAKLTTKQKINLRQKARRRRIRKAKYGL